MSEAGRIRRVVVAGPEAVGKSTLAQQLAARLGVPMSEEYARSYAERVQRPLTAADVEPIARGQLEGETGTEQHALATRAPLIVLDTDLVSTVVYATHYYGACPDWILRAARERRADLYLLLAPDLPWIPDGIRDQPENREGMHQSFRQWLQRLHAHVVEIEGTGAERLEQALRAVQEELPV